MLITIIFERACTKNFSFITLYEIFFPNRGGKQTYRYLYRQGYPVVKIETWTKTVRKHPTLRTHPTPHLSHDMFTPVRNVVSRCPQISLRLTTKVVYLKTFTGMCIFMLKAQESLTHSGLTRAGHFRYFFIFSLIKNYFFAFLSS